ncbi:MAG: Stage sporulation protein [Clostridia bacterium]|nr:Stage sporulation protein [Clostridia bacterium]
MGLLIILVIIKPFIMAKNLGVEFQQSMEQAEAFIEQPSGESGNDVVSVFQNNAALDIYKQKLSEKVVEIVKANQETENSNVQVTVDIENDINKEDFGAIKGLQVYVDNSRDGAVQASVIQPVKINTKTVINKKQAEYNLNNSKLSQDLRLQIEAGLGLKDTNITVEVQE